ncbi:MAG TPA: GAF domain-containing protein [Sinomonas sp.]|nr:GAF domain-containing protein [Sinomonas sp.]
MGRDIDPLLSTLLDIRTVFDPESAIALTLRDAIGPEGPQSTVVWVALRDPGSGLVVEHVLGQRTPELEQLGVAAGQGLTGRVFERATIHWVDEYAGSESITHEFDGIIEAERVQRMIAAPLRVGDSVLGVLSVGRRDRGSFGDDALMRVEQLARRASLALEIARRTREGAAAAALAERRRVSEELHDGVGALLFSLGSRAERLQRRVYQSEMAAEVDALQRELGEVSGLVRSIVAQWHATASSDLQAEIQGIVEDFERRSGIRATAVSIGSIPRLDSARITAVSRFVGVALANVERHSTARAATVTLASLPNQLSVAVSNDGPPPSEVVPGIGLGGAEERIARLGGELMAFTDEDEGFTVRARIPL